VPSGPTGFTRSEDVGVCWIAHAAFDASSFGKYRLQIALELFCSGQWPASCDVGVWAQEMECRSGDAIAFMHQVERIEQYRD